MSTTLTRVIGHIVTDVGRVRRLGRTLHTYVHITLQVVVSGEVVGGGFLRLALNWVEWLVRLTGSTERHG